MKRFLKNMTVLSCLTVAGLHVANCYIEEKATKKHILTSRNGHYYHWKYGDIFYTKQGNGTPLLLIHNLTPDSSAYEWTKILSQLSKNHTVYTLDLLGCGRSEKPQITYTNYLYVQLVNEFISKVIGKKTDVITSGHSFTFTIMTNLLNPDLIRKMIFINPDSIQESSILGTKTNRVSNIMIKMPILGTYLYNILMRKSYIKDQCNNDYCGKQYFVTTDMIDAYYESAHLNNSKGRFLFASIYSKYTNVNTKKALSTLQNPVLLIESEAHEKEEGILAEYQKINPDIQGTIISKTTCLPHMETPRRTLDQIRSFLEN
ncbi:MAG: alpha/beta hydrolase [Lachnospiraceae bacterium]|jgi:pimeloyl-ACP methyl ester carboxylesterase|nr:alpha/beta hydrolase [Lachnospiraceae bacterium]